MLLTCDFKIIRISEGERNTYLYPSAYYNKEKYATNN